jgi:hypothetical protein
MDEFDGDLYYPSLIGIAKKRTKTKLLDLDQFKYDHKYAFKVPSYVPAHKLDGFLMGNEQNLKNRILKKISSATGITFYKKKLDKLKVELDNLTLKDLASLYEFFSKVDEQLDKKGDLGLSGMWQLLLDGDGLPGSNPPWGYISAINLNNGRIKWKFPFGEAIDQSSKKIFSGDMNFGGNLITKGGLVFATGTRDKKSRAYNLSDGREVWQVPLAASGSAPPMTYFWDGCQYIVFTITGGRFVGFRPNSDSTIAFKLSNCG